MESNTLNESMMSLLLEEAAWKDLSREIAWTEDLLEKYKKNLDWEAVSGNGNILWTVSMLEKFRNLIDWKEMSSTYQDSLLCPEVVEKFADYWDWTELSGNNYLPIETVEKMADRIVWKQLLNTYHSTDEKFFSKEFLKKFEKYIPASILSDSNLWDQLVEDKKKEIQKSLCQC